MTHLRAHHADWTWHVGSPVTIEIGIAGVASAALLSQLRWRLAHPGPDGVTVHEHDALTVADDAEAGMPVVSGHLPALDLLPLTYIWQLHGWVEGIGPEVLAEGTLTLSPLHGPVSASP